MLKPLTIPSDLANEFIDTFIYSYLGVDHGVTTMSSSWVARLRSSRELVRWDSARKCFVEVETNKSLTGITAPLRSAFYPDYRAPRAQASAPATPAGPRGLTGFARGRRVDRELTAAVNNHTPPAHPYTRTLLSGLRRAGFTPLVAQVPVYDRSTGLATAVDVVCERQGRLVLVEVKAGWNDHASYDTGHRRMRRPCEGLRDSPSNQHMLQLLVTRYLFATTFGVPSSAVDAVLVRVSGDGVRFVRLKESVAAMERAVVRELIAHIYANRATGRSARR